MSLRTLTEVFFSVARRDSDQIMLSREGGSWRKVSSREFCRKVIRVANALRGWEIAPGDRIAILSENRPEWTIADFSSLLLGAVTVPVYCTLTAAQTAYILQDCGARVIFVSSAKHLEKLLSIVSQTATEKIVVMDAVDTGRASHMGSLMENDSPECDVEFERSANAIKPDDLATIVYTSGTTGISRGAMLTHENMAANLVCSLNGFDLQEGDLSISFLPLSHITARHVDFAMLRLGVTLAYVPFMEMLPQAMLEIRPTVLVAVPRVYEKIHTQVELKAKGSLKQWIYRRALSVGMAHQAEILAGNTPPDASWRMANRLVFAKIHKAFGGRAKLFISGGAPLGRQLAEWYATVGIRIHEGYGLTETSPVIAVNTPRAHRLGTVGKPLDNVEARIAEDGEILVRGPSVFKGYWKKPEETQQAFVNGWFKTGDLGSLDADGFLSVTDRKKDMIKTSGGKLVAPQPIENSLKHNALIAEAVVLGDRRKFPAVLIAPYFPLLENWARENGITFPSRRELVANQKTRALFEEIVEQVNQNLARFEKLKRVLLIAEEFSPENDTLTASMKVRRRAVEQRYRQQIEDLYVEAETMRAAEVD